MKAVVMTSTGGPEVLQLREVNEPRIGRDTEMLVRLKAASVNPIDLKLPGGAAAYPLGEPAVLGCVGAGIVEQVGTGVTEFAVGDKVYFCQPGFGARMGNYAEYVVVDQRIVARKPQSLSFQAAAAVPLVLITAWEALHDRARIGEGQDVMIHGGAGGVGHMAVQLAKLSGARVCATVRSEGNAEPQVVGNPLPTPAASSKVNKLPPLKGCIVIPKGISHIRKASPWPDKWTRYSLCLTATTPNHEHHRPAAPR